MYKTIGLLAHVDAGKTTFSEQLLYHTKSIRQRGRVDHRDAFLDSHEIEKERGITVFADQAVISYHDTNYYLIDTPGHVDFSPEMERSIQVMDGAIVILSAVEGIEGHTETVWQLLRKHHIPTFFFINKTDRVGANVDRVIEEIRSNLTENVCVITKSLEQEMMDNHFVEFIAERDEHLLETYMETGVQKELWLATLKNMISNNEVFPCASGSALQGDGVSSFFEMLDELTMTNYSTDGSFGARVYKIRHDEQGTPLTFIKVMKGTLTVRDLVSYGDEEHITTEKITQIRQYNGQKFHTVEEALAGSIVAVTGLSKPSIGDGLGVIREKASYEMVPTLKSRVIVEEPSVNIKEVLKGFMLLGAEDPSLNVIWEETLQQIHIHVMGAIQLEVLQQLVKERFQYNVSFEEPEILYKETIDSSVNGYGHFEPLGHYAEVHLQLEPGERKSGITFENNCHADDLTIGHQNLIRHHLFEREHKGLLLGSPLTDVKVTLLSGRAHQKHTSGGDFREATHRALRQGLEKAMNKVLEPYYRFTIKVDIDQMGKVLGDIQQAHGHYDTPFMEGNKSIITGKAPVATFMNYGVELAAYTQGKGSLHMVLGGYFPCHNEEEVIQRKGYNKNADPEYSSSSIFCSKGKGYTVPWDEAEKHMHVEI